MTYTNQLKEFIQSQINIGRTKFAIYPYGKNGHFIHELIRDYYGIEPAFIIDNELCKYNKRIISFDYYNSDNHSDTNIILTIENPISNDELFFELLKYNKRENIFNILSVDNDFKKYEEFSVENILGLNDYNTTDSSPSPLKNMKHIGIIYEAFSFWSIVEQLYLCLQKDANIDITIIIETDPLGQKENIVSGRGFHYQFGIDEGDRSWDAIIVTWEFGQNMHYKHYRECAKKVFMLTGRVFNHCRDVSNYWDPFMKKMEILKPDYCILDPLLYEEAMEKQITNNYKLIEMCNPKFDLQSSATKNNDIPKAWKKLTGKKVVLYSTTHGAAHAYRITTFDLYAKVIFKYARMHKDIAFVIRLHPELITELKQLMVWSEADYEKLLNYVDESDNIVWDENDTYFQAFSVSDAILVDGYCGMLYSSLPLMKPVIALYRDREVVKPHKNLVDGCYQVHTKEDLVSILDEVVIYENDFLYDKRKSNFEHYIKNTDGKNSENICRFIMTELSKEDNK